MWFALGFICGGMLIGSVVLEICRLMHNAKMEEIQKLTEEIKAKYE